MASGKRKRPRSRKKQVRVVFAETFERRIAEEDLSLDEIKTVYKAAHWLKTDPPFNYVNRKEVVPGYPQVQVFIFGDFQLAAAVHERKQRRQSGELIVKTFVILAFRPRVSRGI